MKRLHLVLVLVAGTVLGMLLTSQGPLGSRLYPAHDAGHAVTDIQMRLLLLQTIAQAVGFGVGLVLLVARRQILSAMTKLVGGRAIVARLAFFGAAWSLMSWIPHIGVHQSLRPGDVWGLIGAEFAFHLTVVAASVFLVAWMFAVSAHLAPATSTARVGARDAADG